ncbi:hypothetical protein CRG98_030172 [Punica granatum]|uniref:Uncharacterized protein n=1 Tax=Punica granatum TaxID=22663 RepID=A0A2I0J0H7_PUNGR|nr:hypothetical protein CRG98_030172 [Punica granatum]
MQQQFERMNVMVDLIYDRLERRDKWIEQLLDGYDKASGSSSGACTWIPKGAFSERIYAYLIQQVKHVLVASKDKGRNDHWGYCDGRRGPNGMLLIVFDRISTRARSQRGASCQHPILFHSLQQRITVANSAITRQTWQSKVQRARSTTHSRINRGQSHDHEA